MNPPFRIAVFQRRPVFDDIAAATARMLEDLRWCATQGVRLALFPECYLQGYSTDREAIARRAIEVDGPQFKQFASTFSTFSMDVVVGFIERRTNGFYNSAAVVRDGEVVGVYAKNHPNEREFLAGDASPVFEKSDLRYGINICFDANFPDSAKRLADQSAQLICYPLNNMLRTATADQWRDKSLQNLRDRAVETGCWIASSDVVGSLGDRISHGCSCIVSPDGVMVARVAEGVEGVAVYDLE